MYRAVRGVDREIHANFYPQIFYTEMYLLEGGYKAFHSQFPELCTGSYLPMADKSYKNDCKEKFSNCRKLYKQFSTKDTTKKLFENNFGSR